MTEEGQLGTKWQNVVFPVERVGVRVLCTVLRNLLGPLFENFVAW